jgi:hypothetical protein
MFNKTSWTKLLEQECQLVRWNRLAAFRGYAAIRKSGFSDSCGSGGADGLALI